MNGNLEKAIADYTKVVEIDPRYTNAYLNRAAIWLNKGDTNRSKKEFLKRAFCSISDDVVFQSAISLLEKETEIKSQSIMEYFPSLGSDVPNGTLAQEIRKVSAISCSTAIIIPQIERLKKSRSIGNGDMPPDKLRLSIKVFYSIFEGHCNCVLDKVSSKWGYKEMYKDPAAKEYTTKLISSGECPLPSFQEANIDQALLIERESGEPF